MTDEVELLEQVKGEELALLATTMQLVISTIPNQAVKANSTKQLAKRFGKFIKNLGGN